MTTTQKIEKIIKTNLNMVVTLDNIGKNLSITFQNMNDVLRFKASSFVRETFNKAFTPDGEDLEDERFLTLYYRA